MNQAQFTELCDKTHKATLELLAMKGAEYAGTADRLANFKRGGTNLGLDPLTVLHVYMGKHWDSFTTFVKNKQAGTAQKLSEPIEGRLHDIINYAVLALALIEEGREMTEAEKNMVRQQQMMMNSQNAFGPSSVGVQAQQAQGNLVWQGNK